MRNPIPVSVKLHSMLLPVLAMSFTAILVTWQSLSVNSTELIRALQLKELASRSLMLVITQSDATKSMILDPDSAISGRRKIAAYDANLALLRDIALMTESEQTLATIRKLTWLDDNELQPVDTLLLEALLDGHPLLARKLYSEKYEPSRSRYETLVRQLGIQADQQAAAAARSLQDKNRASLRAICLALGVGTLVVATILILLTKSVTMQLQAEINARRKTMDDLAAARDQALEAASIKSSFLANMSHEIRTPMNGLLGLTELVLDTDLDHEQRESLETALHCGQGLLELLNNILDLSKIEAGKLTNESIDFDLIQEAQRTIVIFGTQAKAHGVELKWEAQQSFPCFIRADAAKIRQVMFNLVGNAIKFTAAGKVVLSIEWNGGDTSPPVARIVVTDTGIGMAEQVRGRLFEPFTQGDNSTTRQYGGTGLGLAICKRLVESMGGMIGLNSELGKGSSFWFTIPFQTANAIQIADAGTHPAGPRVISSDRARPHILVAEDNRINQRVLRSFLDKLECDSEFVDSGIGALAALNRSRFDLILMDCQMPEMDGYAATAEIRTREDRLQLRRMPIIALTAHALAEDRERCLSCGMDDFLTKPVGGEQIARVLATWLPVECEAVAGSVTI